MSLRCASLVYILLAWCAGAFAHAEEWVSGNVVSVHDGDTATVVTTDRKTLRVRFYGVDAPERENEYWPNQAFAREAQQFMQKLIDHKLVAVRLTGERTYQREVGEIFVDGRSASRELLRAGFGWWNTRHARLDSDLERLEAQARQRKVGLWRDGKSIAPWRYRAQYRSHDKD